MCPALSITKPEPSACCVCVCGWLKGLPKKGLLGVLVTEVEVTWTTPGALRR